MVFTFWFSASTAQGRGLAGAWAGAGRTAPRCRGWVHGRQGLCGQAKGPAPKRGTPPLPTCVVVVVGEGQSRESGQRQVGLGERVAQHLHARVVHACVGVHATAGHSELVFQNACQRYVTPVPNTKRLMLLFSHKASLLPDRLPCLSPISVRPDFECRPPMRRTDSSARHPAAPARLV